MEFSLASVISTANIAIIRDIKERFGIEKRFSDFDNYFRILFVSLQSKLKES